MPLAVVFEVARRKTKKNFKVAFPRMKLPEASVLFEGLVG